MHQGGRGSPPRDPWPGQLPDPRFESLKGIRAMREQFPVAAEYAYFNHAAIAPLPKRTAEAMRAQVSDAMRHGVHGFARWTEECAALRRAAAKMLGCGPDEIGIMKNTSEGLSAVANGVAWRRGDVVVGLESDFPANYVPWRALCDRRGVRFRSLRLRNGSLDLDDLDRACRGARLAALSYVHYLTGFRWDLAAVGEICRRRGCLLVLDAVQGMGAFPIDVKRCGVHALAASGHKWLLGPEGSAVFFVDRHFMPELTPSELGWASLAGFEEYRSDGDLRPDASRFECGTLNAVGCAGLRTSIELLNGVGVTVTSESIHAVVERLADAAAAKGYELAAARRRATGSGIVSLRKEGIDSGATVRKLLESRVSVADRHGWIRFAPHFYNTTDEVDRLAELLP